jgi:cytochrome b involved in lipid metabolism
MDRSTSGSSRRKVPGRGNGSSLVSFQKFMRENKNPNWNHEEGVTILTIEEVAKHNTINDCWTIFQGVVYNIGPFLEYHPGGIPEIMKGAGRDSTELYMKFHPWVNADAVLGKLRLGKLVELPSTNAKEAHNFAPAKPGLAPGEIAAEEVNMKSKAVSLSIQTSFESEPSTPQKSLTRSLIDNSVGIFRSFNAVRGKKI